jgi:hypothetical protein
MTRRAYDDAGELLEWAFQEKVLGLARFYGWRVYHPPDNRAIATSRGRVRKQAVEPGFPDLVLVRGPELIFAELKTKRGRVSPAQRDWLEALRVVGELVHITGDDLKRRVPDLVAMTLVLPVVDVYEWRPAELPAIEARLARGREVVGVL